MIERDELRANVENGVGIHKVGKRGKLIRKLEMADSEPRAGYRP